MDLQVGWASQVAQVVNNPPANAGYALLPSLVREDPLEKERATHFSILVWRISWTEKPGGLQSMGSQRVGHNHACKKLHRCAGVGLWARRRTLWGWGLSEKWAPPGSLSPSVSAAFPLGNQELGTI